MKKSLLFALFLLANVSSSMAYYIELELSEALKLSRDDSIRYDGELNGLVASTQSTFWGSNQIYSYISPLTSKLVVSYPDRTEKICSSLVTRGRGPIVINCGLGMICVRLGASLLGYSDKVKGLGYAGLGMFLGTLFLYRLKNKKKICRSVEIFNKYSKERKKSGETVFWEMKSF